MLEPQHSLSDIPHILVVDDDMRLRKLLMRYLHEQGWMVTTAADADDARAKLATFIYDAMVLDVMMPRQTGIDFLQNPAINNMLPPTLMLTAMGEVDDRIKGLQAGADDYLAKPFEPKELLLRLQKIMARGVKIAVPNAHIVRFGEFSLDLHKKRLNKADSVVHLTDAESAILILLAQHLNHPLSRDAILRHMAQDINSNDENNSRMVDVLINRLRRKIEFDPSRPIYLQTMRGEGYVLRD